MSDQTGPPYGNPPPPPPPYGYQPYAQQPGPQPPRKGFFASLFDFSFRSYVGPSLIKVLYVLIMVLLAVVWLGFIIGGFNNGPGSGVLALVLGGIGFVVYLAFSRIGLELCMALFRITEDVQALRRRSDSRP